MKIATWNVNSIKVRLPHLLEFLQRQAPDVLALQEIKTTETAFPRAELEELGYQLQINGQPTYNGVALISRTPATDVVRDIPGLDDPQRRVLAASFGDVRVIDVYVVNGQAVGSDKYRYKLEWLGALTRWLQDELQRHPKLVLLGDFNIAPDDRDVHDPEAWEGLVLCSEPERAAYQGLLDLGLFDTYRALHQAGGVYSWWDYRQGAFRRNAGLRIDMVLASEALRTSLQAAEIDMQPRRLERPSDHAPVLAEFGVA